VLREYTRKTNIGCGIGIVLEVAGRVVTHKHPEDPLQSVGLFLLLIGAVTFVWGCGQFAKAKGYSVWFGLLGIMSLPGLIALALMSDQAV
jgi:hypothetical protein